MSMRSLELVKEKACSQCKSIKPFSEFSKHKQHADGLSSNCKVCKNSKRRTDEYRSQALKASRVWRDKNPDRVKVWSKKFRESDYGKTWIRNDSLKRLYGITVEQYNEMFESQKGCCAICLKHQSECKKRLAVDHDHETGATRSLLCHHCNTGIGAFRDNSELLDIAIKYLKAHKGDN